jgi:ribonuclease III
MKLDIKLSEAKQAIGIPTFRKDDLLIIALTDLSTLDQAGISSNERDNYKKKYRRLAMLGDSLFDAVLIDYLIKVNSGLTQKDMDDCRQKIAPGGALTEFAIELMLPEVSSSWNKKNRKPPREEPRLWGEMFEAVVGTIFLDQDRNFVQLSKWLCDRFIRPGIGIKVGDSDHYEYCCNYEDWWDDIAPTYYPGENDD